MVCFTEGEKLNIKERERLKPLNSLVRHIDSRKVS